MVSQAMSQQLVDSPTRRLGGYTPGGFFRAIF